MSEKPKLNRAKPRLKPRLMQEVLSKATPGFATGKNVCVPSWGVTQLSRARPRVKLPRIVGSLGDVHLRVGLAEAKPCQTAGLAQAEPC